MPSSFGVSLRPVLGTRRVSRRRIPATKPLTRSTTFASVRPTFDGAPPVARVAGGSAPTLLWSCSRLLMPPPYVDRRKGSRTFNEGRPPAVIRALLRAKGRASPGPLEEQLVLIPGGGGTWAAPGTRLAHFALERTTNSTTSLSPSSYRRRTSARSTGPAWSPQAPTDSP